MEKKKETKSMTIIVIILMIMVLGLGGYITYDKVLSNKDTEKSNKEQKLEVTEDEATQVMKKFLLVNDNGNECPSATSEIAANSNGKISNEDLFYSVGFYIELSNVTFTSGTSGKNMCTTEVINEMVKENLLYKNDDGTYTGQSGTCEDFTFITFDGVTEAMHKYLGKNFTIDLKATKSILADFTKLKDNEL